MLRTLPHSHIGKLGNVLFSWATVWPSNIQKLSRKSKRLAYSGEPPEIPLILVPQATPCSSFLYFATATALLR